MKRLASRIKRKEFGYTTAKACHAAYVKKHYADNKAAYVDRAKRDSPLRYKERMEFVRSLKTSCSQCGENHPAVLDFHHTDPTEKEISVSQSKSKKQILSEIQKCIVLCSNCHRKLHWKEREGE